MNARGDFTENYEEAHRLLKEQLTGPRGEIQCPECDMQQIEWTVEEGESEIFCLNATCEYCGRTEWLYFDEKPPW